MRMRLSLLRIGTLLKSYHSIWKEGDSRENFFFWLDLGEGRHLDLANSPRAKLDASGVRYLDPHERAQCLVTVRRGLLTYTLSSEHVHTATEGESQPSKWIYVVDPSGRLYIAKKVKGRFHHSSFLAGGTAKAAGNLTVHRGVLTRISRESGHYRPSEDDLLWFLTVLQARGLDTARVLIEDFD